MAFCELKYTSKALGKMTAANVIFPENGSIGPFAVLYLLHGLSDDHSGWARRSNIERYVADYPLIVVMPDGGRGFYTDAEEGMPYETAIAGDLVNYIDTIFQTKKERTGRALAGLSMGGYGAARLALRFPDRFVSAHSLSGALAFGHRSIDGEDARVPEFRRIVGANPQGGINDLFALSEKLPQADRPALRIDCGVDDFLIEDNREFHRHLDNIGYAHEYEEYSGAHSWEYWDEHVREAVEFSARHLGIQKVA